MGQDPSDTRGTASDVTIEELTARIAGLEERIAAEGAELARRPPQRRRRTPSIPFLFICGCPRSGTTALTTFLNQDERILLGQERFRRIIPRLEPFHFTEAVFFNPTLKETSWARPWRREVVWPGSFADYQRLRERWRGQAVELVGDKAPYYHRHFDLLADRFPGARFVLLVRDLEGVARSYRRRAHDPVDHWPEENDHRLAIRDWHDALKNAAAFLAGPRRGDLLVLSYSAFFGGAPDELDRLYGFLDLELDGEIQARHSDLVDGYHQRRSADRPLPDDVAALLADARDRGLEEHVYAASRL